MTFGTDWSSACLSIISTPFRVHAPIITPLAFSGEETTTVWEYTDSLSAASSDAVSTISNITTITSGLAVVNPGVVGWQIEDFSLFPGDYATSLAQRIGVAHEATPASSSGLPTQTNLTPETTSKLSTASKAGIGVGVAIGVVAIGIIVGFLIWKRRWTPAPVTETSSIPEMEDQDTNLAKRKWFFGGRWRSEAEAEAGQQELDSKTVHIVPGPPGELPGSAPHLGPDTQTSAAR